MKLRITDPRKIKPYILTFLMVPVLLVTLAVVSQPQRFIQFASETFSAPPLFGCLQVGEGSKEQCGSKLGVVINSKLTLHGRPIEKNQVVYYGDRITGSISYKNVGDLPIDIQNFAQIAVPDTEKDAQTVLSPTKGKITIKSGQTLNVDNASFKFHTPNAIGKYSIGAQMTTTKGDKLQDDTVQQSITVNSTCTALRIKELTAKDKKNITDLCKKDPKNKLCQSKQYCEIFKGGSCPQPNLSKEVPDRQCDEWVLLDKPEQDILEEICKVYPNTDACKNFCQRQIGAKICPPVVVTIDAVTGKQTLPKLQAATPNQQAVAGVKIAGAPGSCVNGGAGFGSCGTTQPAPAPVQYDKDKAIPPPAPVPAKPAPKSGPKPVIKATGTIGGKAPAPISQYDRDKAGTDAVDPSIYTPPPPPIRIPLTDANKNHYVPNGPGGATAIPVDGMTCTPKGGSGIGLCYNSTGGSPTEPILPDKLPPGPEVIDPTKIDNGQIGFFDFGSSQFKPDARSDQRFAEIADYLKKNPGSVTIFGGADSVGSQAVNEKLGNDRASSTINAYKAWCAKQADKCAGADAGRLIPASTSDQDLRDQNNQVIKRTTPNTDINEGFAYSRSSTWLPGDHSRGVKTGESYGSYGNATAPKEATKPVIDTDARDNPTVRPDSTKEASQARREQVPSAPGVGDRAGTFRNENYCQQGSGDCDKAQAEALCPSASGFREVAPGRYACGTGMPSKDTPTDPPANGPDEIPAVDNRQAQLDDKLIKVPAGAKQVCYAENVSADKPGYSTKSEYKCTTPPNNGQESIGRVPGNVGIIYYNNGEGDKYLTPYEALDNDKTCIRNIECKSNACAPQIDGTAKCSNTLPVIDRSE